MSRLAVVLLSLAAAVVNAVALTSGLARWTRLDELDAAAAAGLLALIVPALAVALVAPRRPRQSWEYLTSFAVLHLAGGAAVVALVLAGSLGPREDLLGTARRLRARAFAGPAATADPFPAPRRASASASEEAATPLQNEVLVELNRERRRAGLSDVPQDPALSRGCQLHAQYLARNFGHPSTVGLRQHEEDPALPGYSEEGARAAAASNVAHGNQQSAVALWMATIYHRTLLLDPRLDRVGIGLAEVPPAALGIDPARAGHVIATVMHVASRERTPSPSVAYPGDGQEGVPLRFAPEESPNPLAGDLDGVAGFPVSVDFYGSDGAAPRVTDVRAELFDAGGREIPCHLTTPERPLVPGYGERTVGLIPESPLVASTEYRVSVEARVDGAPWSRSWSFRTARGP